MILVSVHYYPRYAPQNTEALRRIVAALQPAEHIAVFNRSGEPVLAPLPADLRARVVAHTNEGAEFGAYDVGLQQALSSSTSPPRWVVFVNDTLGNHAGLTTAALRRFEDEILRMADADCPIAVGKQDAMARSFVLQGLRGHRWMRTHFFALNGPALEAVGRRMRFVELDALIAGGPTEATFFSPALHVTLRDRLRETLFAVEGVRWYGAKPLGPDNADRFAVKARSILHEMYLSLQLENESGIFIDVSDLRGLNRWVAGAHERIFIAGRKVTDRLRSL